MGNRKKDCNSCSFYIEDIDIQHLKNKQQIELEKYDFKSMSDDTEIDLSELANLLGGTVKRSCVGGLVKHNKVITGCKYHTENLPFSDKDRLLQSFINKGAKIGSKNSMIATVIFGIIAAAGTIFGIYNGNENSNLKDKIGDSKIREDSIKAYFIQDEILLNDSIIELNNIIKSNKNE